MNNDDQHVIPSSVNSEAAVFRGCTATEMAYLIGVWFVFWFVVLGLVGYMMGFFVLAIGFSFILMIASAFISAMILQQMKSGKPDGYYMHLVIRVFQSIGFSGDKIIDHSGSWDTLRSQKIVLLHRDLGGLKDE